MYWKVKRYVIEEYEAVGNNREEAIKNSDEHGGPTIVTATHVTAVKKFINEGIHKERGTSDCIKP